MYSLSCWSHDETGKLQSIRITSAAIVEGFSKASKPTPKYLTDFLATGCRYSYEDFDTLSAALHELRAAGITERMVKFTVEK